MTKEEKTYVMINKSNGARIKCTEKYLMKWISMGFEVEEITNVDIGKRPDADATQI